MRVPTSCEFEPRGERGKRHCSRFDRGGREMATLPKPGNLIKTEDLITESSHFITPRSGTIDAAALATELATKVRGEVGFDEGSRALYATDASNYRQAPIGVVHPKDTADILQTVATARRYGA